MPDRPGEDRSGRTVIPVLLTCPEKMEAGFPLCPSTSGPTSCSPVGKRRGLGLGALSRGGGVFSAGRGRLISMTTFFWAGANGAAVRIAKRKD